MNFLILIIIPLIVGLYAQYRVSSAYDRYKKVRSRTGLTGAQAARAVMTAAGINDVNIITVAGTLSDHYDPTKKTLALSADVYSGTSLASLGIAAHEAGHAIQHKQAYAPLNLRMSLVPITMFASQMLPIVMLGGFFLFHSPWAIYLGIAIYMILTFFQLVTLPVEFNASTRAKNYLHSLDIIDDQELKGVDKVLDAAAFTYVAAFVSSLGWLLYLLAQRR